ncbi:MAG: putative sulfate exporter family transporter [Anaeromyxobacteraceae bacterium]
MDLAGRTLGWRHVLLGVAAAAVTLGGASSAVALVGGAALALLAGNPDPGATARLSKRLLPVAVVGLGFGMDLGAVARAGASGVGYTAATLAAAFALGAALTRVLRVPGRTGVLVTVGTAICGGSAIAAAAPVVRAEGREVTVALGTVFLLNGLALVVGPPLGHALGLGEVPFGLWAALAIHDTSSVMGAALQYGPRALEVATAVKLARALWIVPVTLGLAALERRRADAGPRSGRPPVPWFILGFLAAAAGSTYLPSLAPAWGALSWVARRLLVLTLFLVGANLSRRALRETGPRPLALGLVLWLAMGLVTLLAVRAGWIA